MLKIASYANRILSNGRGDAQIFAAWNAEWEVVRHVPGFENNPFDSILRLYELRLKPTCFREEDDKEIFTVDFPLEIGGKQVLGCYSLGDGKIMRAHKWEDYCRNLTNIHYHGG